MILQRAPAKAAVFGFAPFKPGATVTVTVEVSRMELGEEDVDEEEDATPGQLQLHTESSTYTANVRADGTWKVLLNPEQAGGDVSISAACTSGCTDSTAMNYNPDATSEHPSPRFACEWAVQGCMAPMALNYYSNATVDDGSCYLPVYLSDPTM